MEVEKEFEIKRETERAANKKAVCFNNASLHIVPFFILILDYLYFLHKIKMMEQEELASNQVASKLQELNNKYQQ
jgi:hypothetical protein